MVYSMAGPVRKHPWVRRLALALPVITLILLSGAVPLSGGHCTPGPRLRCTAFPWIWVIGYVVLAFDLAGP